MIKKDGYLQFDNLTSQEKARNNKCILRLPHRKCMGKTLNDDN